MDEKFIFVISGGLDSAVSALKIISEKHLHAKNITFLFFDRRSSIPDINTQRAYKRENRSAKYVAKLFKKKLVECKLPMDWYGFYKKISPNMEPYGRNTLIISAACSYAAIKYPKHNCKIVLGFVLDEGGDATQELLDKYNDLISHAFPEHHDDFGNSLIKVIAPFSTSHKFDLIKYAFKNKRFGQKIFKKTWSCYLDGEATHNKHCGICDGCQQRKNGFTVAKTDDEKIKDRISYNRR